MKVPFLSLDRRLFRYVLPHRGTIVFAVLCAGIGSVLNTAPVLLLKYFLTTLMERQQSDLLYRLAGAVVFITLATAVAQYGQNFVLASVGLRIVQKLRSDLVRTYNYLSLGFFHDQKAGDLTSRVVADSAIIQQTVTGVVDLFNEPFRLVALVITAVVLSPKLVGIFLLALPGIGLVVSRLAKAIRRYSRRTQTGLGTSAGLITESIAGAREVRAFGLEDREIRRFEREHGEALRMALKGARAAAFGPQLITFIGGLCAAGVIAVGGGMVVRKEMDAPTLLSFIFAVGLCYDPIRKLTKVSNMLASVSGAADRIFAMLEKQPTVVDAGKRIAPEVVSRVSFDDVVFGYGTAAPVLDHVTLEAKKGEVIALVGESGSGKTTLVSLLPRFYDTVGGRLAFDGVDLRDFTLASLRERVAIVSQDTFLFSDTVRENIRLGRPGASDDEIVAAAKAAFADGFIRALPGGYDTMLGERGLGLSGGQRQRIAIARAILRNAPVLILDEATSALDSESEREVQNALEALMADRTAFVVAHRLSTVRNADRIVVLSHGKVVEVGTHGDLLQRDGEYRRLHEIQFARSGT